MPMLLLRLLLRNLGSDLVAIEHAMSLDLARVASLWLTTYALLTCTATLANPWMTAYAVPA